MGGSGGSYSGGGYTGGGGKPKTGGGGTGGGGGDGHDPCQINRDVTLASPNPAVIGTLTVGDILPVALNTSGTAPVVEVRSAAGAVAGTLAGVPNLLHMHKHAVRGIGKRPGRPERQPSWAEVGDYFTRALRRLGHRVGEG